MTRAVAALIVSSGLCLCATIGGLITARYIKNVPRASVAIIIGFVVAILLDQACDTGVSLNFTYLYYGLLPPIMFNAGLSLKVDMFMQNLGLILWMAVGVTVATMGCLVGTLTLFQNHLGLHGTAKEVMPYCWLLSALFSATDPVAVLSAFGVHANQRIFILLLGESVLNDAVALVLYRSLKGIVFTMPPLTVIATKVSLSIGIVSLISLMIAFMMCFILSTTFKYSEMWRRSCEEELCFVLSFAYATFAIAEVSGGSGIIALFVLGILIQIRHFSTISPGSLITFMNTLALVAENIIYVIIGTAAYKLVPFVGGIYRLAFALIIGSSIARLLFIPPTVSWWNKLSHDESIAARERKAARKDYLLGWQVTVPPSTNSPLARSASSSLDSPYHFDLGTAQTVQCSVTHGYRLMPATPLFHTCRADNYTPALRGSTFVNRYLDRLRTLAGFESKGTEKIDLPRQLILCLGGIRGAMAFLVALDLPTNMSPNGEFNQIILATAVVMVICITTLLFGSASEILTHRFQLVSTRSGVASP